MIRYVWPVSTVVASLSSWSMLTQRGCATAGISLVLRYITILDETITFRLIAASVQSRCCRLRSVSVVERRGDVGGNPPSVGYHVAVLAGPGPDGSGLF